MFYNDPNSRQQHHPFPQHYARPYEWGWQNDPRYTRPPFSQSHPHEYYNQQNQGLLEQLRKPNGEWDYEKIMNHGGQIVSIINQARPLIKQMGPLLSLFKK